MAGVPSAGGTPVRVVLEVCSVDVPLSLRPPRGLGEAGKRDHPPPAPELLPSVGPRQLVDRRSQPRRR